MRFAIVSPLRTTSSAQTQAPFALVAPFLGAALLLGAGGGFLMAAVLTVTRLVDVATGPWWTALAQAHGHLQVYGWAGLFVLGVASHFLPRLRGTPLKGRQFLIPLLLLQVASLVVRAVAQPMLAITGSQLWGILLMIRV